MAQNKSHEQEPQNVPTNGGNKQNTWVKALLDMSDLTACQQNAQLRLTDQYTSAFLEHVPAFFFFTRNTNAHTNAHTFKSQLAVFFCHREVLYPHNQINSQWAPICLIWIQPTYPSLVFPVSPSGSSSVIPSAWMATQDSGLYACVT